MPTHHKGVDMGFNIDIIRYYITFALSLIRERAWQEITA